MPRIALLLCCVCLSLIGGEVGFVEDFALADEREPTLERLIAGSQEHYFYRCLHLQHRGAIAEVDELLDQWRQRHGVGHRFYRTIATRNLLLSYGEDAARVRSELIDRLDLFFGHQSERGDAPPPDLPTRLDRTILSWPNLRARAIARHRHAGGFSLEGFTDIALPRLAAEGGFGDRNLRALLTRLDTPDLDQLVDLILRELADTRSAGFGALDIHRDLTLDQLQALRAQRTDLLTDDDFVSAYLTRLQPPAPVFPPRDTTARQAYLERLTGFVDDLPPARNDLKALVWYHRLDHDRRQGVYHRGRFITYLQIPRQGAHVATTYLRRREHRHHIAELKFRHQQVDLPAVGDDADLVHDYLLQLLRSEDGPEAYAPYLDDQYLERTFLEAKVLAGIGAVDDWFARLDDPTWFQELRQRVEVAFAPDNPRWFATDQPVTLALDCKNVSQLIVKVYRVDTAAWYRAEQRAVGPDIDLDGLVPGREMVHDYEEPPLRRLRRRFTFPDLDGPGTWVVECIGDGISARAVIRKGALHLRRRLGAAGHVFTAYDEQDRRVPDFTVWLGNQVYHASDGAVAVPFASEDHAATLVAAAGERACLHRFEHRAETYHLAAGFHVARESLLPGRTATLLVRPELRCHGIPVALDLLEQPRLTITATRGDDITTTSVIDDLTLDAQREFTHELRVPEGLRRLSVTLAGELRRASDGERIALSAEHSFTLNHIDDTAAVDDVHLARTAAGYYLYVLGKNGEVRPDQVLRLSLRHRLITDTIEVDLKSDAKGRLDLGPLPGVTNLIVPTSAGTRTWRLRPTPRQHEPVMHAAHGRPVRLAFDAGTPPERARIAVFELRGERPYRDRFDAVRAEPGYTILDDLPPGDYRIRLKRHTAHTIIRVRVLPRQVDDDLLANATHLCAPSPETPLQVVAASLDDDRLQARIGGATAATRVHVFASFFTPPYRAITAFATDPRAPRCDAWRPQPSAYTTGRDIGSEYRYILQRRYREKFPGVMLPRPSLLLNPWEVSEVDDTIGADGDFMAIGRGGGARGRMGARNSFGGRRRSTTAAPSANRDFLAHGAAVFANLIPDDDGMIRVPDAALAAANTVRVVAVDLDATVESVLPLPAKPLQTVDRRIATPLDPQAHYRIARRASGLAAGDTLTIADAATADVEIVDTLPRLYRLLAELSDDAELDAFAFLGQWHRLEAEERRERYSTHACHELHLFLYRHDRAFFDRVVRPHLAHKKDKTFVDRVLLGEDLSAWRAPWRYHRLNIAERVLLARRLADERQATARHLDDLAALLDDRTELRDRIFATVLAGRALDRDDSGIRKELDEAEQAAAEPPPAAEKDQEGELVKDLDYSAQSNATEIVGSSMASGAISLRAKDLGRRGDQRQLFRGPGPTRLWAESNWWRRLPTTDTSELIAAGDYWTALAGHDPARPFRDGRALEAIDSAAAALCALAFTDLPFTAEAPTVARDGAALTITATGPVLVFHREVIADEPVADAAPVLMAQNYYRIGDRHRRQDGELVDNFITEEFLTHTPYASEVVVSNTSSRRIRLSVLLHLPVGAMPLQGAQQMRDRSLLLEPYTTETLDIAFYFPVTGSYNAIPAHATRDDAVIAFARPFTFTVRDTATIADTRSWVHISQHGDLDQVLAYLDRANLEAIDVSLAAWRLRERDAYERILALLRRRHHYDRTLWAYAIHHADRPAMREFLRHEEALLADCGPYLASDLMTIDPVIRDRYAHLEFAPLINRRAHPMGERPWIANTALAGQYREFLRILAHKPHLDDEDHLAATYYLLLQDRIRTGLDRFARVDRAKVANTMAYDYAAAWLAFCQAEPERARIIAARYANYQVPHWRDRFRQILAHCDEINGERAPVVDEDDRRERQDRLAATETTVRLRCDDEAAIIGYEGVARAELRIYFMDVELLFSRSPFVQQSSERFAVVAPNVRLPVELPANAREHRVPLPEKVIDRNALIAVVADGKRATTTRFANSMDVRIIDNYGQVQVRDRADGRPVPKVYVKVYAERDGKAVFHKDGYTDLRGRFDYVSVNDSLAGITRFAVLVLDPDKGAVVEEVTPPVE